LAESDRRRYVGSWANQQLPTTRLAEALTKAGRATWVYRVDLRLAPQGLGPGAPHGVDVPLIFGDSADMGMLPAQPHGPVERHRVRALAGIMHAAWVRFIAGGTPGGEQLPEWPRYEPDRRPVMLFDAESRVVDDPDGAIRAMCPDQLRLIAW
jgi:para-nitrobenzyl esterase